MSDLLGRYRVRALAGAALVSCGLLAQPAAAQGPSDVNVQAAALYRAGVTAADEDRAEDARALLLAALRLKQHWQIAANLADAEAATDRYRDAAEHLEFALRTGGDEISPQERKRMVEIYEKARKTVGALTVRVDAPGAEVLVDGKVVGKSPLLGPIFVEAGERTIEARREGYEAASEKRRMAAGASGEVELKLTPLPASSAGAECRRLSPQGPVLASCDHQAARIDRKLLIGGIVGTTALAGAGVTLLALSTRVPEEEVTTWQVLGYSGGGAIVAAAALGGATLAYWLTSSGSPAQTVGKATVQVGAYPGGVVVAGAF
jgi:hypothetical protein